MTLTSDWHIHTHNSCDQASLQMDDLIGAAEELGIGDYGITDHIHTPLNLPDLVASRREYEASGPPARMHFGVEVSVVSRWELQQLADNDNSDATYGLREGGPAGGELAIGLTADDLESLEIEYVIGGAHWPMYVELQRQAVIRDYHRQNMFLATHPLVDIVAHPWWWMGHWQNDDGSYTTDPWLDDFGKIPMSMHDEFADAAISNDAIVEINISATLQNPRYPESFHKQYLEYIGYLNQQGVTLSCGSDCHDEQYAVDFDTPARMLASVGIHDGDLWRLPPRT